MLTRRQAVFAMTAATLLIGSPPAMAQTRLKVVASFSILASRGTIASTAGSTRVT